MLWFSLARVQPVSFFHVANEAAASFFPKNSYSSLANYLYKRLAIGNLVIILKFYKERSNFRTNQLITHYLPYFYVKVNISFQFTLLLYSSYLTNKHYSIASEIHKIFLLNFFCLCDFQVLYHHIQVLIISDKLTFNRCLIS